MIVVLQPAIVALPLRVEQPPTARLARARPTRRELFGSLLVCHGSLFVGTGGGFFCRGDTLLKYRNGWC